VSTVADIGGARAWVSPHVALLCEAALQQPDAGRVAWQRIDWARAIALTSYERAEVAVDALCARAPVDAVPPQVRAQLHGMAQLRRFSAAGLADGARNAASVAAECHVPMLWLKGAAIAQQHLAGFGVRGMGDLDVLVSESDAGRLREGLLATGWRTAVGDPSYEAHHHLPPLTHGPDVRLELHTELFMPGHPFVCASGPEWLARGVAGPLGGTVLPPTWHLVHAAVHWAWSSEGMVGSWQWLHDADWLTSRSGSDAFWQEVVEASRAMEAEPVVGWALWTARALGVVGVPAEVVTALRSVRLGQPMVEREWIARAWVAGGPVRSVRWTRLLWRRAMGPVARDSRTLPWMLGRGALVLPS
jgi:hypothetical protein